MNSLSQKIYLELPHPTESDQRSDAQRIIDALTTELSSVAHVHSVDAASATHVHSMDAASTHGDVLTPIHLPAGILRKLYPFCQDADYRFTVSLGFDGCRYEVLNLEAGDTIACHYGYAIDLGSTTVVVRLVNLATGEVVCEESLYNEQIRFGEDILSRIFYSKDNPEHLDEVRMATVETFVKVFDVIRQRTGVDAKQCLSTVVSGNTTMIHFLVGMDAFCVFSSPYAVHALQPGFLRAAELDLPLPGFVYIVPAMANYLGGDILSGMVHTRMSQKEEISLFFDVGTNGELVVGNKNFLLCGAGAAGPALEGGVVRTGMRAAAGAVQGVKIVDGKFMLDVIPGDKNDHAADHVDASLPHDMHELGHVSPLGICGSGIVDMISELFIHGWLTIQGKFVPEKSDLISLQYLEDIDEHQYAVLYAPGLYFYQSDIDEFIRTKAAAATMMEYMLSETGISPDEVGHFYMAGAFGTHVNKESAINIGMYPDVERDRIVPVANTSLEGAEDLLKDRSLIAEIDRALGLMTYVQFGAVDDFLTRMNAATALPHTDLERYPSVLAKLEALNSR